MPATFFCSQGHTWQFSAGTQTTCPVCGGRSLPLPVNGMPTGSMSPPAPAVERTIPHERNGASEVGPAEAPSVPGFDVLGELGRGGMGVVWLARDLSLDREVALKTLHARYTAGSDAAARFLDEARITGQLQHPGIPTVYQIGKLADGRPYLAMKLNKARTLQELLAERPGGAPEWLGVFEAICQAVGYAHERNVIHRDLKPANVMVGKYGLVQVMDWGLAKVIDPGRPAGDDTSPAEPQRTDIRAQRDSDGSYTLDGDVMGTPAYMPPEQAGGEVHRVDRRSDVFGLGAILCTILTGKPPYGQQTVAAVRLAAVRGNLDDAFARLDASGAEPGLIDLAKRCLAFEPDQRPADGGAVAAVVARLRLEAERRARDAELARAKAEVQSAEQRKRRRTQRALAGALLALLSVAGGVAWWADRERTRSRQTVVTALDRAEAALRKPNPAYAEIDMALNMVESRVSADGPGDTRSRFERLWRDRRMLQSLDEIDKRRWAVAAGKTQVDREFAREAYPVAFREYGLDVLREPAAMLAGKVRMSLIHARLATALDAWLAVGGDARTLELINALDPDAGRAALRRAYLRGDAAEITARVARLDGRRLPAAFALFAGGHPLTPQADAVRILTQAQSATPDDFGLAMQCAVRLAEDELDGKAAYFRVALAIRPLSALAHTGLGAVLSGKSEHDAAFAALNEAIRLDPDFAFAHFGLGAARAGVGDYAGALAALNESVRLNPHFAPAHDAIGMVLAERQDLAGAIAAFREAVRLKIDHGPTYTRLASLLRRRGEAAAALQILRDALALNPGWKTDPKLSFRYEAACCAVLVGTGGGTGAASEPGWPALRKEALAWLAAELAHLRAALAEPADRPAAHRKVNQWLGEADLAGVRDADRLEFLPDEERRAWTRLWAGVRELSDASAPGERLPPPRELR